MLLQRFLECFFVAVASIVAPNDNPEWLVFCARHGELLVKMDNKIDGQVY